MNNINTNQSNLEIEYKSKRKKDYKASYDLIKRVFDIVFSIFAIFILSPIFVIIAIAIKVESKGPIIFRQKRVGLNQETFNMYKFRSMVVDAEKLKKNLKEKNEMSGPMFKIKNDPRVTKVGRVIRRLSLDELPQLFNVLKGEMSLVGPRPSLPEEVNEFEEWMLERFTIKPGLTCYWQVMGRNSIGFEEWMELDIKYVKDRGFILDLKLILKTFKVLIGDSNAS